MGNPFVFIQKVYENAIFWKIVLKPKSWILICLIFVLNSNERYSLIYIKKCKFKIKKDIKKCK